jgi:GNAT superfamily N-acetyltransferase
MEAAADGRRERPRRRDVRTAPRRPPLAPGDSPRVRRPRGGRPHDRRTRAVVADAAGPPFEEREAGIRAAVAAIDPDRSVEIRPVADEHGPFLVAGWRLDVLDDRRWQGLFAVVAVASLAWVDLTIGDLRMTTPAVVVSLAVVTVLSVQGFGFLLPGEIRMYLEMTSERPDDAIIATIGRRNAMLGGVQGIFQLVLIGVMVVLRYGGS